MKNDQLALRGQIKLFLNGKLLDQQEFNQIHSQFREYVAQCMTTQGNSFLDAATGLFDVETYEAAENQNYHYNGFVFAPTISSKAGILFSTANQPSTGVQVYPTQTTEITPDVAPAEAARSKAWSGSLYWLGDSPVVLTDAALGVGLKPTMQLPITAPADCFNLCYAFKTLSAPRELAKFDRLTIEWILTVL